MNSVRLEWREVAEEFEGRLASCPSPNRAAGRSPNGTRDRGCCIARRWRWSRAGQQERAVDLMIAELPYSDNYVELVKCLMARGTYDQAADWGAPGFRQDPGTSPRHRVAVAGPADRDPPGDTRTGCWSPLFESKHSWRARKSPTTGTPSKQAEIGAAGTGSGRPCCVSWKRERSLCPERAGRFPTPGSSGPHPRHPSIWRRSAARFRSPFPDHNRLIEVALYEKRTEDALRWFKEAPGEGYHTEAVAEAVGDDASGCEPGRLAQQGGRADRQGQAQRVSGSHAIFVADGTAHAGPPVAAMSTAVTSQGCAVCTRPSGA